MDPNRSQLVTCRRILVQVCFHRETPIWPMGLLIFLPSSTAQAVAEVSVGPCVFPCRIFSLQNSPFSGPTPLGSAFFGHRRLGPSVGEVVRGASSSSALGFGVRRLARSKRTFATLGGSCWRPKQNFTPCSPGKHSHFLKKRGHPTVLGEAHSPFLTLI